MYKPLIIFLLTFIVGYVLLFSCHRSLDIKTFDSGKPGINVLLLAGTHGNEPAGSHTLLRLQNLILKGTYKIKSGKLTIVHNINPCGYYFDNRYYSVIGKKIDINRMYKKGFIINKQIEKLIPNHNLILDFHEGWGYIGKNEGSIGSSITTLNIPFQHEYNILTLLNKNINIIEKKWLKNDIKLEVSNSLRELAMKNKKSYMLIETSGQNNIQPLHVRMKQNNIILNYILKAYRVI
tara:strand:+ start:1350 stop:2057 length:708 start_codon:yes stop_codon:yes gene_type:complete